MNSGVRKIFYEVSRRYELVNHVLTFGLDILWRKKAAKISSMGGGKKWLDVCSGTGEMAVYIRCLAKKDTMVIATDFCLQMIHKASKKKEAREIVFTLADSKALPFRDETFDLITISFATRNINISRDILIEHLREFNRVLKPGGCFVNLETSQPKSKLIRNLFHLYVRIVVRWIGYFISRSKAGYAYLSNTIPQFYGADEFSKIIRQVGFVKISVQQMTFGLVAIHKAVK